jgi:hypothetical protein
MLIRKASWLVLFFFSFPFSIIHIIYTQAGRESDLLLSTKHYTEALLKALASLWHGSSSVGLRRGALAVCALLSGQPGGVDLRDFQRLIFWVSAMSL